LARALLLESFLLDEKQLLSWRAIRCTNCQIREGEIITEDDEQQEGNRDDKEENQSLAAGVLPESAYEEEERKEDVVLGTIPNDQMLQPSIFTMHSTSLEEE